MTVPRTVLALGDGGDFLRVNDLARRTPWLHGAAVGWAKYGVVAFAVLLLLGWLLARRRDDVRLVGRALLAPVAVLVAVAVNQPFVHAFSEPRPYTRLPGVLVLVARSADASFPSDHATMAGAVAVALLLVNRRLGAVAVVAALLMAAARVYVGAHYPLDVVAGLVLGGLVSAAVVRLLTGAAARLVARGLATPLRPLLTAARQSTRSPYISPSGSAISSRRAPSGSRK